MKKEVLRSTPKDVFLHLFNIVTFFLSIIGFITLFIQYIDALFPDALNYYFTNVANSVRWASSILLVAVPAYLLTSLFIAKDLVAVPQKRDLKLRKWLIYFTLFVSAITIIVDLMIFVYNFLDGGLSTRFFLKVLVVLLVAGAVFGYYLWELKRKDEKTKIPKIIAVVVAIVVLASIVGGFFIVGTPSDQRNRRFDEQRVQALSTLQYEVINYWQLKKVLPENLALLENNINGFQLPKDPDTEADYEYRAVSALSFELCAFFARANDSDVGKNRDYYYGSYPAGIDNWQHEKGRTCFSRTIDPDIYRPAEVIGLPPVMVK